MAGSAWHPPLTKEMSTVFVTAHSFPTASDVLKMSEFLACPSCQEKNQDNPGSFEVDKHLLLIRQSPWACDCTSTCFQCIALGRTGEIRVLDTQPPEIFVSGLCLLSQQMHEKLSEWLCILQFEAES